MSIDVPSSMSDTEAENIRLHAKYSTVLTGKATT